ncbi:MAG: hypothetical protein NWF05_04825 [Candidatus Bathyarchaeota archaeon]|nr:hypothetical protein [Candidatus Bathyarchaeota archaeon]
MNNLLKVIITGAVAAVVTFFALILSGLGTTGLANSEGNWVSLTTVNLGVNEFGFLMVFAVFAAVAITGYALNALDKK